MAAQNSGAPAGTTQNAPALTAQHTELPTLPAPQSTENRDMVRPTQIVPEDGTGILPADGIPLTLRGRLHGNRFIFDDGELARFELFQYYRPDQPEESNGFSAFDLSMYTVEFVQHPNLQHN